MGRDNVTFRFNIDLSKMTVKGQQAIDILRKIEAQSGQSAIALKRVGDAGLDAGRKTAAGAVNFQTATQGMLNLSTATVQTYTSISNLDRANNRAKQSIIAVARAEDLLNNKKQRLNELQNAGVTSGNKYNNMLREIATAEADLTVKQEKMKIEQAAVNDVYMLFATNIANVTISSMQTIAVLDKNDILLKKGRVVAQKLLTLATWDSVRAARWQAGETAALNKLFAGTTVQLKGVTLGTKLLTGATNAFKIALGPVGLILIGISAAMLAYETNFHGMKDAINGVLGIQDDFKEGVDAARNATEEFNDVLGTQEEKLFSLPSSYSGLLRELENIKTKYKEVTVVANENTNAIITNNTVQTNRRNRNFSAGGITAQQPTGQATVQSVPGLPMAYADSGQQQSQLSHGVQVTLENRFVAEASRIKQPVGQGLQHKMGLIDGTSAPIYGFTKTHEGDYMPVGPSANRIIEQTVNAVINKESAEIAAENGISIQEAQQFYVSTPEFQEVKQRIILNVIQNKFTGIDRQQFKVFTPESYVDFKRDEGFKKAQQDAKNSTKNKIKMMSKERQYRGSMRQLFQTFKGGLTNEQGHLFTGTLDKSKLKDLGGVRYIQGKLVYQEKKARLAPSRLRDALAGKSWMYDEDDPYDQLLRQTINYIDPITGSRSKRFDTDELNLIFASKDFSPARKAAYDKYGVDIGKIGDVIPKEDALRIGMLQRASKEYRGIGGRGTQAIQFFGGSATAAYQVKRDAEGKSPIRASKEFYAKISRRDNFNNSLGGLMMNELNSLKGSGRFVYSSAHRGIFKSREFRGVPGKDVFREAIRLGIKGNVEFMDAIKAIPDVDRDSEDNMKQAYGAIHQAETIANDYISMINSAKTSIGFTDAILRRATAEGHSGASMYANISLLSAAKRTNFSNTEIIEESKAKLALTNSQIFAIRFNATRGDTELQDRLRYVDQLEAMSSGTSPL